MRTAGLGVVGAGLIGEKRALACGEGARVMAVHDIDAGRAQRLSRIVGAEVCASFDEMLGRDDVDIVVIATTHDQLTPLGLRAVASGKHVLLEKPAGVDAGQLRELGVAAARVGAHVRVRYNHRFHPSLLRAREIVHSGEHGKLLWIRARYGHGGRLGYDREWRADKAISGGGEMVDQGSHLIDLTRYLVGDVELAFAELPTLYWDMKVEDNAFFALRPLSGGLAWLHASWSEWKNTFSFEVTLERAKIDISGLGGSYGTEKLTLFEMSPQMGPPFATTWEWPFADRSWHLEMEDVLAAVAGRPAIGASLADATAVLEIIGKAYQA